MDAIAGVGAGQVDRLTAARAPTPALEEDAALGGVALIPRQVDVEIARGRYSYPLILAVSSVEWAWTVVLGDDGELAAMLIKARLGGGVDEHIGECAVIAYAQRCGLVAVLDDRAAIEQAEPRTGSGLVLMPVGLSPA
jgi:hypothetical protein